MAADTVSPGRSEPNRSATQPVATGPAIWLIAKAMVKVAMATPQAGIGSEVTLWGRASNGAVLSIDEVAHSAGTVGYELMCALAQRVPVVVEA